MALQRFVAQVLTIRFISFDDLMMVSPKVLLHNERSIALTHPYQPEHALKDGWIAARPIIPTICPGCLYNMSTCNLIRLRELAGWWQKSLCTFANHFVLSSPPYSWRLGPRKWPTWFVLNSNTRQTWSINRWPFISWFTSCIAVDLISFCFDTFVLLATIVLDNVQYVEQHHGSDTVRVSIIAKRSASTLRILTYQS